MEVNIDSLVNTVVQETKNLVLSDIPDFLKHLLSDCLEGVNKDPGKTIDEYLTDAFTDKFKTYLKSRILVTQNQEPQTIKEVSELKKIYDSEQVKWITVTLPRIIFLYEDARKGLIPPSDLVDVGFFFRELVAQYDEQRKEVLARLEGVSAIIAWNLLTEEKFKKAGTYATAYPEVKMVWRQPKKGSKEERILCDTLGIPEVAGPLKFGFKETSALLQRMIEDGVNIPDEIQARANPTVSYRRKSQRKEKE